MELIVIWPEEKERENDRLHRILDPLIRELNIQTVLRTVSEVEGLLGEHGLQKKRLLFAAHVEKDGINLELCRILKCVRNHSDCLFQSVGGVIIDAAAEAFSKSVGRTIVEAANSCGCNFPGRPLVEATGSLKNQDINARNRSCSLEEAYACSVRELIERIVQYQENSSGKKQLLCIHCCDPDTSNTYWLWSQVKKSLSREVSIKEVSLRYGKIMDCAGCSFETCMYYSKSDSCFYGGTMVEEIYPAMQECDALLLLCPNYNDALSANLTAFINRLTALFRKKPFDDKYLFAIIVSGYSGEDIIREQLIDALNMNKSFRLPAKFALSETANLSGSITKIPDILKKAEIFGKRINFFLC